MHSVCHWVCVAPCPSLYLLHLLCFVVINLHGSAYLVAWLICCVPACPPTHLLTIGRVAWSVGWRCFSPIWLTGNAGADPRPRVANPRLRSLRLVQPKAGQPLWLVGHSRSWSIEGFGDPSHRRKIILWDLLEISFIVYWKWTKRNKICVFTAQRYLDLFWNDS